MASTLSKQSSWNYTYQTFVVESPCFLTEFDVMPTTSVESLGGGFLSLKQPCQGALGDWTHNCICSLYVNWINNLLTNLGTKLPPIMPQLRLSLFWEWGPQMATAKPGLIYRSWLCPEIWALLSSLWLTSKLCDATAFSNGEQVWTRSHYRLLAQSKVHPLHVALWKNISLKNFIVGYIDSTISHYTNR